MFPVCLWSVYSLSSVSFLLSVSCLLAVSCLAFSFTFFSIHSSFSLYQSLVSRTLPTNTQGSRGRMQLHYFSVVLSLDSKACADGKELMLHLHAIEFLQLGDLRHVNINSFIGASVDTDFLILVTEYCSKGSLTVRY